MSFLLIALLTPPAQADEPAFRFAVPTGATVTDATPAEAAAFEAAAASADFGVKIEVEIDRAGAGWKKVALSTPICFGDRVAFTFTPSEPGYAFIVNQGTNGETVRLFPHHGSDDNRIAPGQPARFPPEGGFPVVDTLPGAEGVMLFISPEPLSWAAQQLWERMMGWGAPEEVIPAARSGVTTRQVEIKHLRTLGPANHIYAVGRGELALAFTISHVEPCPTSF